MTTKYTPATPVPWHVSAIDSKRGRITGDETSQGWDKLDIHGANANVARVYRPADVRFIAHAANAYPQLVSALRTMIAAHGGDERWWETEGEAGVIRQQITNETAALLRSLGEDA